MIYYLNRNGIGEVLLVYKKDAEKTDFERKQSVARIFDAESDETIGFNFFEWSAGRGSAAGALHPDKELIRLLNRELKEAGFADQLAEEAHPLIVTGRVLEIKKHPNSDHMHICRVDVGESVLQIVCGAPNIDQGQMVVVAKIGALMPDGMIIRPTILRGVDSDGMICSARELALPGTPQKRGILVLNHETETGRDFFAEFKKQ